jgi:hypothetical protein
MTGNGRRVAGFIAIVVAVIVGVFDLVYYMGRHPHRGIVIIIVCGVLLVLGVVLVAIKGSQPKKVSG